MITNILQAHDALNQEIDTMVTTLRRKMQDKNPEKVLSTKREIPTEELGGTDIAVRLTHTLQRQGLLVNVGYAKRILTVEVSMLNEFAHANKLLTKHVFRRGTSDGISTLRQKQQRIVLVVTNPEDAERVRDVISNTTCRIMRTTLVLDNEGLCEAAKDQAHVLIFGTEYDQQLISTACGPLMVTKTDTLSDIPKLLGA